MAVRVVRTGGRASCPRPESYHGLYHSPRPELHRANREFEKGRAVENEPVWEGGEWHGLPALAGSARADVCVVGLGGSGLSCVAELHELGVGRVIGIDAGRVAG